MLILLVLSLSGYKCMHVDGIIFQPVQQIVIAEQFAEVQLFLPFPSELPPLTEQIQELTAKIDRLALIENRGCEFFNESDSLPNAGIEAWLLARVQAEHRAAQGDNEFLRNKLGNLMRESPTGY